jgi:hypothetical protein
MGMSRSLCEFVGFDRGDDRLDRDSPVGDQLTTGATGG